MDLKKVLPKKKKKESSEHFWSLAIEPEWVQAGIWKIDNEKAHIVSSSAPAAWELEDELISTADAALSSAIQNLHEAEKEPSKTVFGVVASWVKDGEIKDEYLGKIKKICSKLSLTPVGFVVIPEAVAHFVKSKEGAPLNAVVLGISKENIEMSIFKLGNLVGTSEIARSVSVFEDVAEGLSRFTGSDFPTRFILYDGKEGELEDVRQALMKANWDDLEKIRFLHTPKVEILSPDEKIHAVSLAGASEMGDVKSVSVEKVSPVGLPDDKVIGENAELENVAEPEGKLTASDLGFTIGSDIATQDVVKDNSVSGEEVKELIEDSESKGVVQEKVDQPTQTMKPIDKGAKKQGRLGGFAKLKPKIPRLSLPFSIGQRLSSVFAKKALVFGIGFLALIFVGAGAAWWFVPKAQVTVYLSTKRLEERVTITIDPSIDSADFANGIISGSTLTTEVLGDDTASTTGTKTVGEKAKGEVTLYRVGPSLALTAGTEIKGPSSLSFELDADTTLASGSAGSAGTTIANVTAVDLGAQYNLAGGTTFSVSNYSSSDIEAKNSSAFTGGSSREINAVSEDDQKNLEKDLKEELTDKAKEELMADLSKDKLFIEESLSVTVDNTDFSHKVDDEASTLKLSMTLTAQALIVDKNALTDLAKEVLKDRVPDGFVLRGEQIDMEFEVEDEDDGKYELTAYVVANLLPEIDPEGLAQKIRGKYPSLAESYLTSEVPGFARAEISLKPKLPGRLGTLPHVLKNIEVEITAER